MSKLFEELKHRKVVRVAGVYAVVAWLLIQVTNNIVPALQLPAWTSTFIVVFLLIGFPIALVLAWAFEVTPDGVQRESNLPESTTLGGQIAVANTAIDRKFIYATFGLVLVVAVFQIAERFMGAGPTLPSPIRNELSGQLQPLRTALPLGELERFTTSRMRSHMALSPDGRWLVHTAKLDGAINLQLRDLVTGETRTLVSVAEVSGRNPFNPSFSPSGEQILYYVNGSGEIHVIPRTAGRPQNLSVKTGPYAPHGSYLGAPAWLSEESIVFSNSDGALETLNIPTGEIVRLNIPPIQGEAHVYPKLIGDGPWLLYTVLTGYDFESARLDAFNMNTGEVRNLVANGYRGQALRAGVLVYMRDNGLWAVNLDLEQMLTNGAERLIEQQVEEHLRLGYSSYALSESGRLVYLEGGDMSDSGFNQQWVLSSRTGERQSLNLPGNAYHPALSPDGAQLAVTVQQSASLRTDNITGYIALYHFADGTLTRRSFSGEAFRPKWTPDGTQLIYGMFLDDEWGLWAMAADGSGQPRQLLKASEPVWPDSITPDGASLMYGIGRSPPAGRMRLHLLSLLDRSTSGQALIEFGTRQAGAAISPDGRFIAYSSNELTDELNGIRNIIVRPFPNVNDGQWQITGSDDYASNPIWDISGKSLYSWSGDGDIHRFAADQDNGFRQGLPEVVFNTGLRQSVLAQMPGFAVSPDGQNFLYRESAQEDISFAAAPTHAVLVDNWLEKVREMLSVTN